MKTFNNLYPQIISFENLYRAAVEASLGKRTKTDVAEFLLNREKEIFRIKRELETGNYQPGGYRTFYVKEYGKKRKISAADFRDRVVHHAFCQIIEQIFDKTFIFQSFACRVGKGTHIAIKTAERYLRQNSYVFQGDIVKYFENIKHETLLAILKKKISDIKTMNLAQLIIFSWNKDLGRGVPIGNLTSQFFANLYLNELDYFIKFKLCNKYYVRYMDDFILFGKNKKELWNCRAEISKFLSEKLTLFMHKRKSAVYPTANGVPFLGFRIFNKYRRIKNANVVRFMRRIYKLKKWFLDKKIPLKNLQEAIRHWICHARVGDTYCLRKSLFSRIVLNK